MFAFAPSRIAVVVFAALTGLATAQTQPAAGAPAAPFEPRPGQQGNPIYAAMIEHLDNGVGLIMQTLKETGRDADTVVAFTSDNGGATNALFATGARSPEEREASGAAAQRSISSDRKL